MLARERAGQRSEEHTSELQSPCNLVCRILLENSNSHSKKDQRILFAPCRQLQYTYGLMPILHTEGGVRTARGWGECLLEVIDFVFFTLRPDRRDSPFSPPRRPPL